MHTVFAQLWMTGGDWPKSYMRCTHEKCSVKGRVTYICVGNLGHHWFGWWLVAWSVPSYYLKQCWDTINWTVRNKFQWYFNRNSCIFIQENALGNFVCEMAAILSRPQCVNSWLMYCTISSVKDYQNWWSDVVRWKTGNVNSSPPSDAYLCQWIVSALVQIVVCRLFGAKPLFKPMLGCCQLDH